MKSANGYLTSNRHIRYPFEEDSTAPDEVLGCFVDAAIQPVGHNDPEPVVSSVSASSSTITFKLAGRGEITLSCTRSRSRFPVVSGTTEWCRYAFVLSSDGIGELVESGKSFSGTLRFSRRCICEAPSVVDSILVYGGTGVNEYGFRYTIDEAMEEEPDAIVSGDASVVSGYNMEMADTEDGITLSAVPGGGAGVAPCGCDSSGDDGAAKWLVCENGHARLFNDTCYDVEAYQESRLKGFLKIHAKCTPCCTCEMYESIVNGRLIPLRDKIEEDAAVIDAVDLKYEEYVNKWNDRLHKAFPEDIVVTMTAVPLDAAATDVGGPVFGKMDRCGFSVSMRNDSFVDVTMRASKIISNGDVFQSNLSYMEGDSPKVVAVPPDEGFSVVLKPGRSAVLSYFVRLNKMVQTDSQSGFMSKIDVEAFQGDEKITTSRKVLSV